MEPEEGWIPIDPQGWYEISTRGRTARSWRGHGRGARRGVDQPVELVPFTKKGSDRRFVTLRFGGRGRHWPLDRLVLERVKGVKIGRRHIWHLNGDRGDDRPENLDVADWAQPTRGRGSRDNED